MLRKISNGARQRTIKNSVRIEGIGLQTGKKVTLDLKGSPPNSGISFLRTDLANKPILNIRSLPLDASTSLGINPERSRRIDRSGPLKLLRRTTLGAGAFQIQTTEHFLAALSGASIDNISAELDAPELPGLDGSAKGFLDAVKRAGIIEQDAPKKILKIDKAVWCEGEDSILAVFPSDDFKVSYTLSYKDPALGTKFWSGVIDEQTFEGQIAPARTFCLKEEARTLLKMGLGKGASYENTLVMDKNGPVNNVLRFPDEPVRHKVLDLVGDLYLLGMRIKGHVVAVKSGHTLNMELVKKLKALIV